MPTKAQSENLQGTTCSSIVTLDCEEPKSMDRCHKLNNATKLAAAAAGLWIIVLLTTVCNNFLHGPFDGDANWNGAVNVGRLWLGEDGWDNLLCAFFYEAICKRKK